MDYPLLDTKTRLPFYAQIADRIRAKVQSGDWLPREQIPTEADLCEQYQVSRITVRRAIAELVQEGYLVRYAGRGTFVAEPRLEQRISHLTSFTQDMEARGMRSGARVLKFEVVEPPSAVPWAFPLCDTKKVILLRRLRLADGEPLALENSYLCWDLCASLLEEDLQERSLYALLIRKCKIIPSRAVQQWTAIACPKEEARLLGILKGQPVLHIYRTTFSQDDLPFEWVESYYRGDKYSFQAEMQAEVPFTANS
jgi:GntR family transcriptional regulator